MSFEEAYNEFLIYASKRHKKQGFETLQSDFKSKILPYFSSYDIFDLNADVFIHWQNELYSLNYKNSYLSKIYIEFNSFLDYCCSFLNLPENYLRKVGPFPKRFEEKQHDFYTLDEFNQFIKCVKHPVYKAFFSFMFFTGVRPGECMALKFSDINNGYVKIDKTLTNKGGRCFDTPKTQSSFRLIKLDKYTLKSIEELKKYYFSIYDHMSLEYYVFGGPKYLAPTTINRYKVNACKLANIRSIKLHEFRHSHATLLMHNGIVINEISRRLGHSKVSTTLDIYTHSNLLQEKRVFDTLNSMRFNFFETLQSYFKNFISLSKR